MNSLLRRGGRIEVKTAGQIEAMRAAGAIVARALRTVSEHARAGVSTAELDELAEQTIRDSSAVPSFKGYHGFPGSICTSVNERIVHGIPVRDQVLADGDLLSVDCGAILDGWHGDAAVTIGVGEVSAADERLSEATRQAMLSGIERVRAGGRLSDISHAIERRAQRAEQENSEPYGIVREYGGHGIGTAMHMAPFLPNHGSPGKGLRLKVGMALAVEPMLTAGTEDTVELSDGWTVVTADGRRAAHWEHSVAVTENGPWILTEPEGG